MPAIVTVLSGADGPLSLTGTTVRIQIDRPGSVVNAVAVVDPDQVLNRGRVSYQPIAGDVATPGVWSLRWEITYPGGSTLTVPSGAPDVLVIERQIA